MSYVDPNGELKQANNKHNKSYTSYGFTFEVVVTEDTKMKNNNECEGSGYSAKTGRKLTVHGGNGNQFAVDDGKGNLRFIEKSKVKPVTPTELPHNSVWFIKNTRSNKYMDVRAAGTADGTAVQQYTFNGTNAQQWKLTTNETGFYHLKPMNATDKSLQTSSKANATVAGKNLQINKTDSVNRQRFIIAKSGSNYRIITKHSVFGDDNLTNTGMGLGTSNNNDSTNLQTKASGGDTWVFETYVVFGSAFTYTITYKYEKVVLIGDDISSFCIVPEAYLQTQVTYRNGVGTGGVNYKYITSIFERGQCGQTAPNALGNRVSMSAGKIKVGGTSYGLSSSSTSLIYDNTVFAQGTAIINKLYMGAVTIQPSISINYNSGLPQNLNPSFTM